MELKCKHCGNKEIFEQRSQANGIVIRFFNVFNKSFDDSSTMHDSLKYTENKYMHCNVCSKRVNFSRDELENQRKNNAKNNKH